MLYTVLSGIMLFVLAPPQPLISGMPDSQAEIGRSSLISMDRESSLHPEHDPESQSYSGRRAPGPYHNDDTWDPHDEVHDPDLPANQQYLPAKEEQDKYYKGGLHVPD